MAQNILHNALNTIALEADAIKGLEAYIDEGFEKIVQLIANSKGRVIISGIGKSAVIAQKIVATFNSTGTAAVFMHAADAIHGDLGMVQRDDIVMIISKSGESPEIKVLIPLIRNFGNILIGMVGSTDSYLARQANYVLNTTVSKEACPNNLAPTTSTTAQMVMGDAMAVCLMELKGFQTGDFAKFHPGGLLGKKLYMRVSDLFGQNEKPAVFPNQSLKEVIVEMTKKRLGITAVVNQENQLLGIITDGDLRRMLEKDSTIDAIKASDIMTHDPVTIAVDEMAIAAMELMREKEITQLIVANNGIYKGILHLHDLVREGLI